MAKIAIQGICMTHEGYGELGCKTAWALKTAGHDVTLLPCPEYGIAHDLPIPVRKMIPDSRMHITKRFVPFSGYDISLAVTLPVKHMSIKHTPMREVIPNDSPINAIETMWEADHLPSQWVRALNTGNWNLIVVPHIWVKEMFVESGVKKPIKVITPGIDKQTYQFKPRNLGYVKGYQNFRFLQVGRMEPRKNVAATIEAFHLAFPDNPEVELLIKTRPDAVPPVLLNAANVDKRIRYIHHDLPEAELTQLYYSAHAFVYPSMGEGFSYPPRNAMATGLPTLVTNFSAMRDIPGAIQIPVKKMVPMPTNAFVCGEESRCRMAQVDIKAMAELMYDVWVNYPEYVQQTKEGVQQMLDWKDFPEHFIKTILEASTNTET